MQRRPCGNQPELALKIAAVVEANLEKSRAYAYRQHQVTARLDKNGKQLGQHSQTWEVIGLEGVRYRKLVQRDDKPLPLKEAAKRRADRAGGRKLFSTSYSLSIPHPTLSRVYDLI